MKPLLIQESSSFIERFSHFIDGELRSFEILSPTTMRLTLGCQDSSREFDWVSMVIEFHDIIDASLAQSNTLHLIDMSEGITLNHTENFIFKIKASSFYIVSENIKYQEGTF